MTRQETERALKLCSSGPDADCGKCAYAGKGCFRSLMRDSLRYIGWLKNNEKKVAPPKGKEARGNR